MGFFKKLLDANTLDSLDIDIPGRCINSLMMDECVGKGRTEVYPFGLDAQLGTR